MPKLKSKVALSIRVEPELLEKIKKEFPADSTTRTITNALTYALKGSSSDTSKVETLSRAIILMLSDHIAEIKYPKSEAKQFRLAEKLKAKYAQLALGKRKQLSKS